MCSILEPAANGRSCEVAGRPTSPILPCTSALINRSRLCSSTVVPALLIRSRPVDVLSFECIASCCQAHNKNPSAWPGSVGCLSGGQSSVLGGEGCHFADFPLGGLLHLGPVIG